MLHEKSPRAVLMVWAIVIVLLSPIVILFLPITITQTFYYDPAQIIVLAPTANHYLLTLAFGLVFALLVLLAIKRSKWTYLASVLLAVVAIVAFVFSTLSYVIIHPDYITVRDYWNKQMYTMDQFEAIIYEYGDDELGRYQFITKNGEAVVIQDSPQLHFEKRGAIYKTALNYGIKFTERPLEQN